MQASVSFKREIKWKAWGGNTRLMSSEWRARRFVNNNTTRLIRTNYNESKIKIQVNVWREKKESSLDDASLGERTTRR